MKKLFALTLSLLMLLAFAAGCADNGDNASSVAPPASSAEESAPSSEAAEGEISLQEIADAVKEVYGENYLPSMEMTKEDLVTQSGVKAEDIEDFIAEIPMISTHVDTFYAIKAVEGKGEDVEKALNEYRDTLIDNSMNYPMNIEKVNATQVVRHGDYVFLVMLGAIDERRSRPADFAKEEVQKGIDAINAFFK